jgi:hypothetical protein
MGMYSTDVQAPQPSSEERELQREQLELLRQQRSETAELQPFVLKQMGLTRDATGDLRKLTEEEIVAGLSPIEKLARQNLMLQQERVGRALRGELEVDPVLERGLLKEQSQMDADIAMRLGSKAAGESTAAIQRRGEFQERAGLLRAASRRGEISSGTGLELSRLGLASQQAGQMAGQLTAYPSRLAGLTSQFGTAMQPFQYQRGLEFQAAQQTAANKAQFISDLASLGGSVVGMGL